MKQTNFTPKPATVIMAMWQYLGRLALPTVPTAGIHWGAYLRSGGPTKYIGMKVSRG